MLLGISTSGNASNVGSALVVGRAMGMTHDRAHRKGRRGDGRAVRHPIAVPAARTFEVQELHLPVYHCLCAMVEERFFP